MIGEAEIRLYNFAKHYFRKEHIILLLKTQESLDIALDFNNMIFDAKKILNGKDLFSQTDRPRIYKK